MAGPAIRKGIARRQLDSLAIPTAVPQVGGPAQLLADISSGLGSLQQSISRVDEQQVRFKAEQAGREAGMAPEFERVSGASVYAQIANTTAEKTFFSRERVATHTKVAELQLQNESDPTGYAAAVAAVDVAISKRRPSKCANRTGARSVAATATTALQNLSAFIFGNHALNLEQEIILRRIPDRPVQKHDVHAGAPKLVDEQRLMGVAPSQAIRGMDIQALDLAASGRITKSLERRAYKDRAAEAFVDITIIWFEHKAIGCDTLAQ